MKNTMINYRGNNMKKMKRRTFLKSMLLCELILLASFGLLASNLWASGNEVHRYLSDLPFEMPEMALPEFPDRVFNVIDFGAIGNGMTVNTTAINTAIKACAQSGGGTVIVPKGLWLTGPLKMANNVNLHLQNGALVIFSPNRSDYPIINLPGKGFTTQPLIYGEKLENVAITGEGIFDGCGENWRPVKKFKTTASQWQELLKSGGVVNRSGDIWYPSAEAMQGELFLDSLLATKPKNELVAEDFLPARDFLRPELVLLNNCKRVLVDGPTFKNSPKWAFHTQRCENIIIRNVKINNEWWAQNGDGIDISSCKNVLIYKCTVTAGDDAICMKSSKTKGQTEPSLQNVVVRDCIVYRGHGGLVIGSNTDGGMQNIFVDNCIFIGTDIGLRFKSARDRGGLVENVIIRNIYMKDIVNEAILFNTYYENIGREEKTYPVTEKTPIFTNFRLDSIFCFSARQAIGVVGLPEMPVHRIVIRNSILSADVGVTAENARDFTLENVTIIPKTEPILHLTQCANFHLDTIGFPATISTFMTLSGKNTQAIHIKNTALSSLKNPIIFSKEVNTNSVIIE